MSADGGERSASRDCVRHGASTADPLRLLGLSQDVALRLARSEGTPAQVVCDNGETLPTKADLQPGRLGLHVERGVVVMVAVEEDLPPDFEWMQQERHGR